jgi:hypothetical protein
MQGFMQGRQMRDQEQLQQQEISGDKLKNAMSVFQMLGQIGQSDPQALNSPEMQAFVKQNMGGSGIPLPTNPQGGIDVNVFRTPLTTLTSGPLYDKFLGLPKGSAARQQMLSGFGGTDEEKQNLLGLDQQLSPAESDNYNSQLRYLRDLVTVQGLNPDQSPGWQQQWNFYAGALGQPLYTPGMFKPSAKTTAGIAKTEAGTNESNARTGLDNQRAQWIGPLAQSTIGLHGSQKRYLDAQGAAIPVKLMQGWQRINIAQQNADTSYGQLQAHWKQIAVGQQNADANTQRVALQAFTDTTKQLSADQNLRKGYVGMLAAFNAANANTPGYDPRTNGSAKSIQGQIDAISKRIGTEQQFIQVHPRLQQALRTTQLHKQGAPNNIQVPRQASPGPAVLKKGNLTLYRQPDGSYSEQQP